MNTRPLHFNTTCSHPHRVNFSLPATASSSGISCEEDDTPSCQVNCRHSQKLNQICPARFSHSAEEKRDELRPETTREHLVKSKSETTVDEKLEYAKISLGFAFPMLVSLVVASSEITKTTGARTAVIALSFALASMCSGLPLRKTYPKISAARLIFGVILTMLSVYYLVYSSLPSHLKMILVLCGVVPLIALVLLSWAYFQKENNMKDPEVGEVGVVDEEEERIMNEFLANPGGVRAVGEVGVVDKEDERIMNQFLANLGGVRAVGEARVVDEEEERIMNEFLTNPGGVRAVREVGVVDKEEERIMNQFLANPGGVRVVGEVGVVDEEEERIMNQFLANPGGVSAVGEAGVVDEEEERIMNEFLANPGSLRAVGEAGILDEEEEGIMNQFLANRGGVRAIGEVGVVDEEEERIMNQFLANPGGVSAAGEAGVVDEEEERIMNEFLANPGGVRAVGEAGIVDEEEEEIMNEFLANPGGVRAVWEAGIVDEEERIMNEFLAPGMFSLDEEAEFMQKKEIVINIIPESGASLWSLSSLHSRAGQQSIGHLSEGPGRHLVAIGNRVHYNLGPIRG